MSSTISAAFLLCAPLLGAGALAAQSGPIRYAPGSHRYRVTSTVTYVQEAHGRKAKVDIDTHQQVTIKVAAHGRDTLDYEITLDSITVSSKPAIPLPDVTDYVGLSVKGAMSTGGKVFSLTPSIDSAGNPAVQQFVEGLRHFLVAFPANAKVGSSWADTITAAASPNGQAVDSRTITTSRVAGDTAYAGQKAWRVERSIGTAIKGTVDQGGQPFPVEGNGTGSASFYVSQSGVYLGSTMSQKMTITSTAPDGTPQPITQTAVSKTELIP
ncbi:MAG TPA: hypothetical protein VIQ74_14330 [Gemmatimonadaceae bacterium]